MRRGQRPATASSRLAGGEERFQRGYERRLVGEEPGSVLRVEELAQKSAEGALTPEEQREYAEIVRLNDRLSLLKLEAEELWTMRAAS
ncbi:hypothetical protein WMF04_32925 [Sorangium sp. So ce260]|uniref:hypothetical protein n=1 Tax=Sorangium sp. So ce260 TaxID=3133291 RepID=UPI003F61907F